MSGRKSLEGGLGETNRDGWDDGKRASSAIEVAKQDASPLKGVWGKQVITPWIFRDDGKRASAAIEVLRATAQRLSRGTPDFRGILDGLTC